MCPILRLLLPFDFDVSVWLFLTAVLPFTLSDKVSYCIEFFPCWFCRVCKNFFCKTNFITDLTLLLHQRIVQVTKLARRKKKRLFHFVFHCFRIIVVIVAGAIQLMRFYWKNNSVFFCSEAFITHLNISNAQVSKWRVEAMFKRGNELMDFQFNFAFLSQVFLFP